MMVKDAVKLRPIMRVLIMPLMVIASSRVSSPKKKTDPFVTRRNFLSLALGSMNFL